MIDENAVLGILVSYFRVEEDEYGMNREEFVEQFRAFRDAVRAHLRDVPLGVGVRMLDVGHALYVEIADGDQTESPLGWAKKIRARLAESGFDTVTVVTHGGRWIDEDDARRSSRRSTWATPPVVTLSHPERAPYHWRRALYAEHRVAPDGSRGHGRRRELGARFVSRHRSGGGARHDAEERANRASRRGRRFLSRRQVIALRLVRRAVRGE